MTSRALMSTIALPHVLRVTSKSPFTLDGTKELRSIAQAASYLQDEFDASFGSDIRWLAAASALEAASDKPAELLPHACRALDHLLETEKRIVLSASADLH